VDLGVREARKTDERLERLVAVAAWRESPLFNDAERAALAFAEAATRLSDRADPVPDDIWKEAARFYEEPALAQLVMYVALVNLFNRVNVATRQVAGTGF
jgi:alkylhydroperoxidase family enzyme